MADIYKNDQRTHGWGIFGHVEEHTTIILLT